MVRALCCDKMGLKKGPWTPEEDQILISYLQKYGHTNWRALPKQAGLLRCGKSCRLRWINYLRPDLKRGNFTPEEEETIIHLHETLGNRWSMIASRLPGRTDNEIKNVWHTRLKKRLEKYRTKPHTKKNTKSKPKIGCESSDNVSTLIQSETESSGSITGTDAPSKAEVPSSSEISSISTNCIVVNDMHSKVENMEYPWEDLPEIDQSFWSDQLSSKNSSDQLPLNFEGVSDEFQSSEQQVPLNNHLIDHHHHNHHIMKQIDYEYSQNLDDAMRFWYDLFIKSGGGQEFITEF